MVIRKASRLEVVGIEGVPLVKFGDDLAELINEALIKTGLSFQDDDVLVVSETVVSKAEGSVIKLSTVKPSLKARIVAEQVGKPPEVIEVILRESKRIVRLRNRHLITQTKQGHVCANSGVDISNVSGGDAVATLPRDPDKSARQLREKLFSLTGKKVAVIISDTSGRPLRQGQINIAVGVAGMNPIFDRRGEKDLYSYQLQVKEIAVVDELASAAELVMGEASEGIPAALIRGFSYVQNEDFNSKSLIRPLKYDLFI